jgi:hypothetical protein
MCKDKVIEVFLSVENFSFGAAVLKLALSPEIPGSGSGDSNSLTKLYFG